MRSWGFAFAAGILMGVVSAQTKGPVASPPPASGNTPRRPNNVPDDNSMGQRPIFISGTVVLSDGTPLIDRAKIERVCNGSPRTETYTDKKGRFSFEVGHSMELPDASVGSDVSGRGNSPFGNMGSNSGLTGRTGNNPDRQLWGCELRAELAGFRSDVIQLNNIRYMDNPEVGTIVLHRLGNVEGLTISVVSALAPKDAHKAYEKGLEAVAKKKPEEAQKYFEKAVDLYPKYAVAWYELGTVYQKQKKLEDAAKCYQEALKADGKYVSPYVQLTRLAAAGQNWEQTAEYSGKILKLNPYVSQEMFFYSAVANLNLHRLDIAEEHAREGLKMDSQNRNPRMNQVLGVVLAQKQDYAGAAASMKTYLKLAPGAPDLEQVKKQLEEIERKTPGDAAARAKKPE